MRFTVLQAIKLGWSIIPVKANKRPYFKWQEYQVAKPDRAKMTRWNEQLKPPAWAVVTGAVSGLIVLDFDGEQGRTVLEAIGLEPHVRTGSGGYHVYIEHPGFPVKTLNSKSKRALGARYPGVDIRADGGYAVFCGKNSSGSYTWLRDPIPYPVSDVPSELRAFLGLEPTSDNENSPCADVEMKRDCGTSAEGLLVTALGKSSGGRNDNGFWLACQLRDNGFTEAEAAPTMLKYQAGVPSVNTKAQVEPYTVDEAIASLKQAYSSMPREPLGQVTIVTGGRPLNVRGEETELQEVPVRARPWPEPMSPEAFSGLAGDFVTLIGPHTESDSAALLLSYIVAFGNVVGRSAHSIAEADRHFMNLFAVQVGLTSKGRKGSSLGQVMRVFRELDPDWAGGRVQSGLSSGEGLIWAVRDAIEKEEPIRENGEVVGHKAVIVDSGVEDKRLFVQEGEFASTLRVMGRDGNTLSAVIRNAWDSGDLRILSKNSRANSTGAHISIIAHITKDELLRYLESTEAGNGFGNRIIWFCARRSKVLPEGGCLESGALDSHIRRLKAAVVYAQSVGQMRRDDFARALWHKVYPELSEGKPGLLGAMTARAEAQVMRLASIYALMDCASVVSEQHLRAALAVWKYAKDSARFIFGDSLGDPMADELLGALRSQHDGMTRTQISNHFGRNRGAREIGRALGVLLEHGLARSQHAISAEGGRVEIWHASFITNEIDEINEIGGSEGGGDSSNSSISYPTTGIEDSQGGEDDEWGEV